MYDLSKNGLGEKQAISQVFSLDGMELLEEREGRRGLGLLWVEKAHPEEVWVYALLQRHMCLLLHMSSSGVRLFFSDVGMTWSDFSAESKHVKEESCTDHLLIFVNIWHYSIYEDIY